MAGSKKNYDFAGRENFNLINAELNSLYFQVKKTKPSSRSLNEAAEPFLNRPRKLREQSNRFLSTKWAFYIGLLSLCISCFIYYDPLNRFVRSSSRKAFTQVRC